jgi:hypothetical protein
MWSRQFLQPAGERGPRPEEINTLVLRRQRKKGRWTDFYTVSDRRKHELRKGGIIMPYGMGPWGWGYHPHGYGGGWPWNPWGYGRPAPLWGRPTKEEEIRFLEEETNFLREDLSQIEKRLEELKK